MVTKEIQRDQAVNRYVLSNLGQEQDVLQRPGRVKGGHSHVLSGVFCEECEGSWTLQVERWSVQKKERLNWWEAGQSRCVAFRVHEVRLK